MPGLKLNINGVELREFNKVDWQCFAGAVNFRNGTSPMTAEIKIDGDDYILVVDGEGMEINSAENEECWVFERTELSQIIFLKPNMTKAEILAMGGENIS